MSESGIKLKDVRLTLNGNAGKIDVLRKINLKVELGETVALIGPSGSGKSSLLMVLGGLEKSTSGSINVLGHNISVMNEDERAQFRSEHMGIVFQAFHLIPTMSAVENVAVPLEIKRARSPYKTAEAILELVGLKDRANHYPLQLSGGEQQRVALARAIVTKPKILLADEPTGNLDTVSGKAVEDLLFELQSSSNSTLVIVTHDRELASRCSRIVEIRNGIIE